MEVELPQAGASSSRRSASSSRSTREADAPVASTSADDLNASIKAEDAMDAGAAAAGEAAADDDDEDDEEEHADNSGESSKSTMSRTRSKKGGARSKKGRRGSAAARARSSKTSRSAEPGTLGAQDGADDGDESGAVGESDARRSVLSEGADVKDEDDSMMAVDDTGYASDSDQRNSSRSRRRSASGLKELAGLGLQSLGDGSDEPLQPRRSRRSAVSPNQEQPGSRAPENNEQGNDMDVDEQVILHPEAVEHPKAEPLPSGSVGIAGDEVIEQADIVAPEDEAGEEGVTRCLCGSADENVGLMIQCETCKCWQHCICMGMRTEEDCPDVYFCEQCRPELHLPLLRLLGVYHAPRNKKGSKSRNPNRDASKELREAKEAVLTLAKENERRRKEGREVITGWSVAQRQEQDAKVYQEDVSDSETLAGTSTLDAQQQQQANMTRQSAGKRTVAIDSNRLSRSASRDELPHPKSPPKRRSTMNSRESVFGWEPLPPGLLAEGEVWDEREEKSRTRRRRGGGAREDDNEHHTSTEGGESTDAQLRGRLGSPEAAVAEDAESIKGDEEAEEAAATSSSQPARRSQPNGKKGKETDRPKHPNQYTKRAMAAAAAANGERSSPSPSPNKKHLEGTRRSTREVATSSRMGTPSPGDANGKNSHTGQGWGMPDHLGHLKYLVPATQGPEPLKISQPTTKGQSSRNAASSSRDPDTDRITRASPQPFNVVDLTEAASKVRYPSKRMTLGESKRRVRQISEQLTHMQIDRADRQRRLQALGLERNDDGELVRISSGGDSAESSGNAASGEAAAAAGAQQAAAEEQVADKALAEATGEAPVETKEDVDAAAAATTTTTELNVDAEANEGTNGDAEGEANGASTPAAAASTAEADDGASEVKRRVEERLAEIERAKAAGLPTPFKDLLGSSVPDLLDELMRDIHHLNQILSGAGSSGGNHNTGASGTAGASGSAPGNGKGGGSSGANH